MVRSGRKKKALMKTITWRILAVIVTISIALFFTGSLEISLGIGTVDIIVKTIIYYFHERAWDRVGVSTEKEL
ncbi:MAG: DUF2061 domain-containing protein [Candidatus Thorarchaeota archaeon]